jgi:hypothetical protein
MSDRMRRFLRCLQILLSICLKGVTDVWMKVGSVMQMVVQWNRLRAQTEREQRGDRRYYWRKEKKQTKKHEQKKEQKLSNLINKKKKNRGKRQINVNVLSVTFIISCRVVCAETDIICICAIDMQYMSSSSSYPSVFWLVGSFPYGITASHSFYCCITVSSCVSGDL